MVQRLRVPVRAVYEDAETLGTEQAMRFEARCEAIVRADEEDEVGF